MSKTVSKTLNDLMPSSFDKYDSVYMAMIGNEDTDSGALTNEIKDITQFIDYYTRIQSVNEAETILLEYIISIFAGITRNYSEDDDYLRLRYKALVERKKSINWNSKKSIKGVFSYFLPEKDIYLIERYPVTNLVVNGEFETLDSWNYYRPDTEFKLIYSRSFSGGSSMYINPSKANSIGYMEQQIPSVPAGLYELVFFFSSPKKGIGDVQYSVIDGAGRYWNGSAWVSNEYLFYHIVDIDKAGYYKDIQRTIPIATTTNIIIRFKNNNGNGVLIDNVRFGKVSEPAFAIFIVMEPELFCDGSVKADKMYNASGFKRYYIVTDMNDILQAIKPAGVYGEMNILSSRLNIPWDRIMITWEPVIIKVKWHVVADGSHNANNGGIYYVNLYADGSVTANGAYNADGKKMIRYVSPGDLLASEELYKHIKLYKRRIHHQLTKQLFCDGRIGANGKFNGSGITVGVGIGYSCMKVTKKVTIAKQGIAICDNTFTGNGQIKGDGVYTYYQSGIESYYVKEV
jgi:hypothetical protein